MIDSLKYGFSLIELLVVVAIIVVLAALGASGYSVAIKITRDARREADLKVIQSALEQYHNDNHFYPPLAFDFAPGMQFTNATGQVGSVTVTKIYLNSVPVDPIYTDPPRRYYYRSRIKGGISDCSSAAAPTCQSYCLYAATEIKIHDTLCPARSSAPYELLPP